MIPAAGKAPRHGEDGWELVEYTWDEKTGEALMTYRRARDTRALDGRMTEFRKITANQMNFWSPALAEAT